MVAKQHSATQTGPRPIYVIYGADDFLRAEGLENVLRRLIGDDRDGTSLATFEGGSAELADVLDECRTPSLLSPLRVVCVRDADDFVTAHRKSLEKYVTGFIDAREGARKDKQPEPEITGVLILICRSWPKTTRLFKLVSRIGENLSCEPPKRGDFARWAAGQARQAYGCALQAGAAERLVDLAGDNLGLLNMELAKLATYVAPRSEIRQADVEELVGASRVQIVFSVTDAIAQHDVRRGLALWDQVVATDRGAPYKAVGGLAYGFRRLVEAKRLVCQGVSVNEAMRRLRIWGAGSAADLSRQLERFSLAQWRDHLVRLVRIDVGAKTGLGSVETSVEKFIVELCSAQ